MSALRAGEGLRFCRKLPHHPGMDRRRFLLTSLAGALAVSLAVCVLRSPLFWSLPTNRRTFTP